MMVTVNVLADENTPSKQKSPNALASNYVLCKQAGFDCVLQMGGRPHYDAVVDAIAAKYGGYAEML
eukprot:13143939-Heterocapsa_arctica.AAC.1